MHQWGRGGGAWEGSSQATPQVSAAGLQLSLTARQPAASQGKLSTEGGGAHGDGWHTMPGQGVGKEAIPTWDRPDANPPSSEPPGRTVTTPQSCAWKVAGLSRSWPARQARKADMQETLAHYRRPEGVMVRL